MDTILRVIVEVISSRVEDVEVRKQIYLELLSKFYDPDYEETDALGLDEVFDDSVDEMFTSIMIKNEKENG